MLQVIQYQKKGDIVVSEMPPPVCPEGGILVRSSFSLISAGTEKTSVSKAKSSLLERAKKQPEDVKLVLDFIKKEGILSTYKRVKSKLDSYKSLGYSSSGIVIESRSSQFSIGDRVACAGAGIANHAEIIAVPSNLAVKIPENVDYQSAAYTTVAAIAMQGVRQADVRIGETVAVIGLGLIGQITIQLLRAAGCRVIGLDINEKLFDTSISSGAEISLKSSDESLNSVMSFTRGLGCDAVLITAGTSSNQPIELALNITRKKGKVVIVGAVGMNIPRTPFYMKEIDLRISCSYGPGRYDVNYEEKGIDYPAAYVRWTENRNMSSILDLLSSKTIDFNKLTTHSFRIKDAPTAYDLITGKIQDDYLGILLEYDLNKEILTSTVSIKKIKSTSEINIGFIGLGTFARNYLIPPLQKSGTHFAGVSSKDPVNAKSAAENLGFDFLTANGDDIISDDRVNTVFIASRHDSHSGYVVNSLKAGKNVFVEKPLAVNQLQLDEIRDTLKESTARLMVGFNRRFSKSFKTIFEYFSARSEPLFINYRINAGFIPKSHWVQQSEQGGRIIGEVCHFIDCMLYLTKAKPVSVYASSVSSANKELTDHDNVSIVIKFSDGSLGTISYIASGGSSLPKEFCEVHSDRKTAVMNNFETVEFYSGSERKLVKSDGKKGIDEEVEAFISSVRNGISMPIKFEEIYLVTKATFAALHSLQNGQTIFIEE
ncbi:MAG: bi-domain-containing oxidoreductase [Candidatus Kapabacteria bacterium]|nr:bi-domain-containing oxidoreductase [Ignavibacteriota bacterium]MCW5885826.1 bi-domain-containing oxidoreductase [Candidatus Kapabacteria bacterium]